MCNTWEIFVPSRHQDSLNACQPISIFVFSLTIDCLEILVFHRVGSLFSRTMVDKRSFDNKEGIANVTEAGL